MTISEAITAALSASHHGDQHFRSFLMVDEAAELRAALVALADAARDEPEVSEHQKVAALVCMDLEILSEVANRKDLTADDLREHIRLIVSNKNELIENDSVRNSRYEAALFLTGMVFGKK